MFVFEKPFLQCFCSNQDGDENGSDSEDDFLNYPVFSSPPLTSKSKSVIAPQNNSDVNGTSSVGSTSALGGKCVVFSV